MSPWCDVKSDCFDAAAPGASLPEVLSEIDFKFQQRAPLREILRAIDAARDPLFTAFREGLGTSIAAKAFTLKVLNLLLAKYHFRERSPALLSRPIGLVVDPANGCNLACPGCVHSSGSKEFKRFDWNTGLLSEERFQALLQNYGAYATNIRFYNYGEPTANLNTPKFIQLAKSYLIQTVLSTNGVIKRFDAEAYVRSGLDFMIFSIDGATQPVYEQFRKNGQIDLAFENIWKLVDAKKRLGKETPILRWQFLAFEHNAHEIPLALETAAALGMDQFAAETPYDVSWDVPSVRVAKDVTPSNHELREDTEEAFGRNWDFDLTGDAEATIEREFAARWTSRVDPSEEPSSELSAHTCSWLYRIMVMDANGRILPCCAAPRPEVHLAFTKFPDAEADCFNSADHRRARQYFADGTTSRPEGSPAPHCEKCEWDQTHTGVDYAQLAQYLRTTSKGVADARTIQILADW
jgi:MoaA/NifB/PqqE/SkfB family radical SAM enzyme